MRNFTRLLAASAGAAAIAVAAPAAAQYSPYGYTQPYASPYGYTRPYASPYGYTQPYASPYGYSPYARAYSGYGMNSSYATQQCTAAVQNRLYNRNTIAGILGAVLGTNTSGRVVAVTQVAPRSSGGLRIRGLASSGRHAYNGYSPYGVSGYGALGYNTAAQADLSFKCDVDYRGYVRHVDINRRY